ncbi:MAG: SPOR domain-containing protein [Candidatus Neomarinimicrobiota bacterium]|nr:MAG: SPOR domain-containing protein [bacterium]|tara:strand:- start:925 stop:1350 length:426 start_codon:yes stop_codon:yes gene_type:complete
MKLLVFIFLPSIIFSQNNTSFNPDILIDPEPRWPEIMNPLSNNNYIKSIDKSLDSNITEIEGFRVQVFATQDRGKADILQKELALKFKENIYIIFEAPNYKLRIGDFLDRDKAEILRRELASSNYPSSWILRTKIQPVILE